MLGGEFDDDLSDHEQDTVLTAHITSNPVHPEDQVPSPVQPLPQEASSSSQIKDAPLTELVLSIVAEAVQLITEHEPVEPLQTVQPIQDEAALVTENPVVKDPSPPISPKGILESPAPAIKFLPPPTVEECESSSPDGNQLALIATGLESPVRSSNCQDVTNEQVRTAINNLFGLLQKSSSASKDTALALSSLRQTFREEISNFRRDFARQSTTAVAVSALSEQLARTEQLLEAKMDTFGTQLSEIISFLSPADDKKEEEKARKARGSSTTCPRKRSTVDEERESEEHLNRLMSEEKRRLQAKKRSGGGSGSSWFRR